MKNLKFIILPVILWNLPSYALAHFTAMTGTILSYGAFSLIIVYYFFNKKEKPIDSLILLGLLYFLISVFVDTQNAENFIVTFIKYFIFIIMGIKVAKDTTDIEIYILLLLGALSIIYESILMIDTGGRYSGFYLNPNFAGLICIIGYSLSLSIDNIKLRLLGQLLFSIAGLVTFSRTFLLLWVLISLVSLAISYKNAYKIVIGVVLFSLFLSFGDEFDFNTRRLEAFSTILDGQISDEMLEDSRTQTWALYYDKVLNKPFFGNGYLSMSGKTYGIGENSYSIQGVHNTFLMILGESGIFVFLYFTAIYGGFVVTGIRIFNNEPLILLVSFSLFLYMLTSHNYFDNYFILFVSIWLWLKINRKKIIVLKNDKINLKTS
jgi:hypothetical protein